VIAAADKASLFGPFEKVGKPPMSATVSWQPFKSETNTQFQ
jgi:hypothetical protein